MKVPNTKSLDLAIESLKRAVMYTSDTVVASDLIEAIEQMKALKEDIDKVSEPLHNFWPYNMKE
jgi:hypothetical protein